MRRFTVWKRKRRLLSSSTLKAYAGENNRVRIEKRLDVLFSKIIRLRDKKCVKCGKERNLQCSHIFSRSNKSVRWDLSNAFCLDGGCHIFWWHKNPIEAVDFAQRHLGPEKYAALKMKAGFVIHRTKADLLFLEEQLEEKLKELQCSS